MGVESLRDHQMWDIDGRGGGIGFISTEERLLPEPTPLFRGITRVSVATHNPNKFGRIMAFVDSQKIIRGENPLEVRSVSGNMGIEPDWQDALRVAIDKNLDAVEAMKRSYGQEDLVLASDVVYFRGSSPMLNLSRNDQIDGWLLENEAEHLIDWFSRPSINMWDVALVASRKGLLAGTGKRIVAGYDAVPRKLIRDMFYEDIAGALGRNTRLPLIDDPNLNKYIIGIEEIPLKDLVDREGSLHDWHLHSAFVDPVGLSQLPIDPIERRVYLDELRDQIVGGFPTGQGLNELLRLEAYCCGVELKIV